MELQELETADLVGCYEVFTESVRALAGGCYTAEQCAAWSPEEGFMPAMEANWQQRLGRAWGCKAVSEEGWLAGFAWMTFEGEFDMLFVAPWAGRRGLARRMIARLEALAAGQGVTALHVWASHAARPVFERAGYRVLRANRVQRRGVEVDNWLMAKGGWVEPAQEGAQV